MTDRLDPRDAAALALIVRAQLGERDALNRLLKAIQSPIYEHIALLTRDRHSAKDVLQQVLMLIARNVRKLRDPRLFRAWAFRIATREAQREAQRARRHSSDAGDDVIDRVAVSDDAVDADEAFDPALVEAASHALAELPPACGAAVRMRYCNELSLREISEALDVPLGTVKSRIAYGISLLRKRVSAPGS